MSSRDKIKNSIKKGLRATLSRLNGVGLGLLLRKLGRGRGAGIVMTHCVGHVKETDYLPSDMKTSTAKVEALLKALKRRGIRCVTVRELVERLDAGDPADDLLAFTMDDGYRDNFTEALPLLKRYGGSGTVFVETRALTERKVSWMHRYFYIAHHKGEEYFAEQYRERTGEARVKELLEKAHQDGGSTLGFLYDFKRVLKYEADQVDRERVTGEILASIGRSDKDIAPAYLTWDEVETMDREGIEFGAHTIHHEILSRLDDDGVRREIGESTEELKKHVDAPVVTFAYPFGRPWDYSDNCYPVLSELGYRSSCAAIDGTNDPKTDRWQLKRLPLNDDIPLNDVLAEIDGTFHLARRLFRVNL